MSEKAAALVWLRQDLRLCDQPALYHASQCDRAYAVYIRDSEFESSYQWSRGEASRWWLHESLQALTTAFENVGSRLILAQGSAIDVLRELIKRLQITHVYWNRRYDQESIQYDKGVKAELKDMDVIVRSFPGNCLIEPWELSNQTGSPYKVFTPFSKALLRLDFEAKALPAVRKLSRPPRDLPECTLSEMGLLPKKSWYSKLDQHWQAGEQGARQSLKRFIGKALSRYHQDRDIPSVSGCSKLSPHLHFGEISVRTIWNLVNEAKRKDGKLDAFAYLRQLIWRDFANYSLYHFPNLPNRSLREEFERFPWARCEQKSLSLWQRGLTGFPIIDAGMRELWETGWMHNRVRMIAGSFLVKNLRVHWLKGEKWFWDTLVDADLANNSMGWQWVAGCGIDAAPYFRIFNPTLQSQKFDPNGDYIRRWLPELKDVPAKWIHCPAEAPPEILRQAFVILGKTYPRPMIDYRLSRADALEAYESIKGG